MFLLRYFLLVLIADGVGLDFARNAVLSSGIVGGGSGGCGGDVWGCR